MTIAWPIYPNLITCNKISKTHANVLQQEALAPPLLACNIVTFVKNLVCTMGHHK